jgi:hypothetical protein
LPGGGRVMMLRDPQGVPLRLLPWTTAEGNPCYLSANGPDSRMSRLADEVEEDLLVSVEHLLADAAKPLPPGPSADPKELRRMVACLAGALSATWRIAVSRGGRLPGADTGQPCEHRETELCGGKTCCRTCAQQLYL